MSAKSSKKPSQKSQVKKDSKATKGSDKAVSKRMASEIPPKTKKGAVKKGKK